MRHLHLIRPHIIRVMSIPLVLCMLSAPSVSSACGGFFCNVQDPINQAAERILFAVRGDQTDMHVQVQYQGPPAGFGWILPVTPGVTTEVSSEALFVALNRLYGPIFSLNYDYDEACISARAAYDAGLLDDGDFAAGTEAGEPTVQVISREPVGPYDRAILQADDISALRGWLDENEFQIPNSLDEKLQPYIDAGAVFVVIKLLADRDVGDLVPLKLSFPGTQPTIPVIPTSVAAEPDMGIIVHILGPHRAISTNYRHVQINEAVIDWESSGSNYPAAVSQAVDEAGGRAFTTDYSGEVGDQILNVLAPYSGDVLADLAAATTFGEIELAVPDRTNPDYQRIFSEVFGETDQEWDSPADGLVLSMRLMDELNPIYEDLNELFFSSPQITRLYTTMSADEMTVDPLFSFNPDLDEVDRIRSATLHVTCDDDGAETSRRLELSDGRSFEIETATPVERQEGETVRGGDLSAASQVEQLTVAGPAEVIMTPAPSSLTPSASPSSSSESDDGCEQTGSPRSPVHLAHLALWLIGFTLIMRRRSAV